MQIKVSRLPQESGCRGINRIMDTVQYIRFKQQQKKDAEQQLQRSQDNKNSRVMKKTGSGLGHGYAPDMRDAMKKVNEFDYQPTEAEIHYRRKFSGQLIDCPPINPTK